VTEETGESEKERERMMKNIEGEGEDVIAILLRVN